MRSGLDLELIVIPDRLADGALQRALARDVERGVRLRVRRGVYVQRTAFEVLDPPQRHVVAMRAFDSVAIQRPVFSHWSAAILLGLPTLASRNLLRPHITVASAGSRGAVGVAAHVMALLQSDVTERWGLLCTDLVRTVIDIAGHAPFPDGVAVADAALHVAPNSSERLLVAADSASGRRAAARIARVVAFADGASESPGESISRVTIARIGLPKPVLQHEFRDRFGFAARVDFWFPEQRVAGEMDGRAKYVDPALNGGDPARAVYEEKIREDRVRALDVRFARWGWAEAGSTRQLGLRLAAVGVLPRR